MTDLDKLKEDWKNLTIRNDELERRNRELTRRIADERIKNNQQRLAANYRTGFLGLLFPLISMMLYEYNAQSLTLCIIYSAFGLVVGGYHLWFRHYVKSTDYTSLDTVSAVERAAKIVKYQDRATATSLCACVMLLSFMLYEFYDRCGIDVFISGIIGATAGAVIGLKVYLSNRRNARSMLEELKKSTTAALSTAESKREEAVSLSVSATRPRKVSQKVRDAGSVFVRDTSTLFNAGRDDKLGLLFAIGNLIGGFDNNDFVGEE